LHHENLINARNYTLLSLLFTNLSMARKGILFYYVEWMML